MTNNFIITISGTPGSGKSTTAKMLAEIFDCQRIYAGGIMREMAKSKGMTIEELNTYAQTHIELDQELDTSIVKQAREITKTKPVIVEGRVQFHFLPESIKFFIKVDIKEAARRIYQDLKTNTKRNESNSNSVEEMETKIIARRANELMRYQKYYNIDYTDETQYDLIIDSTQLTRQEVVDKITDFLAEKGIKVA